MIGAAAQRKEWLITLLLLVIMLVKGALWSLAFPLWQGPDEDDHYAVIQFIAEHGRLPDVGDEILLDEITLSRELADVGRIDYQPEERQGWSDSPIGLREAEFDTLPPEVRRSTEIGVTGKLMHATPLYYMIAAQVYRWFPDGNLLERAHLQRLLAVLLSSPLVIVAYLITRLLYPAADPAHGAMRLTVPILVAFQPMISEIAAVVSVDGFFFVLYSVMIYLGVRIYRDGLDWGSATAVGIIFAAGVLVKPTLNGYAPLVALLVFLDFWRDPPRRRQIFLSAVWMNLLIILPVGWWMQRSWRLNNDLFYFNPVDKGHRILQNPFYDYGIGAHFVDYYQSVWGGMFVTWWAQFGWLDTPLHPWVYGVLRVLTVGAVVGLLVGLVGWWRRVGGWRGMQGHLKLHGARWRAGKWSAPLGVWLFLALVLLVPVLLIQVYDLTFWWEYGNGRGMQGRYWLGTVAPMLTFFTAGLLQLTPDRWRPGLHVSLRVGMILLNFAALLGAILPRYYL